MSLTTTVVALLAAFAVLLCCAALLALRRRWPQALAAVLGAALCLSLIGFLVASDTAAQEHAMLTAQAREIAELKTRLAELERALGGAAPSPAQGEGSR